MASKYIINKSKGVTGDSQFSVPLPESLAKPQLANLSFKIRLHHSANRSADQAAIMRRNGFTGHTSDTVSQPGSSGYYQQPATSLGGKVLQGLSGATGLASKVLKYPPNVERRSQGQDRRQSQGQDRRQGPSQERRQFPSQDRRQCNIAR